MVLSGRFDPGTLLAFTADASFIALTDADGRRDLQEIERLAFTGGLRPNTFDAITFDAIRVLAGGALPEGLDVIDPLTPDDGSLRQRAVVALQIEGTRRETG